LIRRGTALSWHKSIHLKPAILILCVVGSILLHATPMIPGFGESDAARLAVLAAEWHETGHMASHFYEPRTSPLYIHALKLLMDAGIPMTWIPALINWINVILGGLILIPLFYLWRRLSDEPTAIIACILITVAPAFWAGSIYGMPHLPAYVFFVSSLLFYIRALDSGTHALPWYAAAVVMSVLAVMLKADIILCFGAYLGAAFCLGKLKRGSLLAALVIPLIAFVTTVIYTHLITPSATGLAQTVDVWGKTFPFTWKSMTDASNRAVLIQTAGRALTAAIVASIAYVAMRRGQRRRLVFALVWALPPILFWGLKLGNSARHMMSAYSVLLFLVAATLVTLFPRRTVRWSVLAFLVVANVLMGPGEGSSIAPASRPFRVKSSVEQFQGYRHAVGQLYALFDTERKLYVGGSTNPYVIWESLLRADSFQVLSTAPLTYQLDNQGVPVMLRADNMLPGSIAGPSREWFIFTFEDDIKVLNYPEFREHHNRLIAVARAIDWPFLPE
jgi:hypothetical protein